MYGEARQFSIDRWETQFNLLVVTANGRGCAVGNAPDLMETMAKREPLRPSAAKARIRFAPIERADNRSTTRCGMLRRRQSIREVTG